MLLGPCFGVSNDSENDDEDDGEVSMLTDVAEHAMNVLFNYVRMVDKTSNV